ncbi:MAG: dienelactone hydrolase family protein [Desulfobacterales bacterium]|nr:dienelactone hydrolase family protein [Desulfobacterales bacterium]
MLNKKQLPYVHDRTELAGYFVCDDKFNGLRPGVLMIHEFTGPGAWVNGHADALARLGYRVLAADMYGKDVRPGSEDEASRVSRIYRNDRMRMRRRAAAGLDALVRQPGVDRGRIGAVGFSFGGCAVLELARSGAPVQAAVSFYGYLNTPFPAAPGAVKGSVLVFHGAHDKVVPLSEISVFCEEMRLCGADCQVRIFTGAGHGFSNPASGSDLSTGSAFCEATHALAWGELGSFFEACLGGDSLS